MAKRKIIRIDESSCDGCGVCVTACAEGAIAIVDGKARLVSERYCDGLGACLGECPRGAITLLEAEAAPFDKAAVAAHLLALGKPQPAGGGGRVALVQGIAECPGSRTKSFAGTASRAAEPTGIQPSALRQWPVQLHLVSPLAPYFQGADLLLAADCVAYAVGGFHQEWLAGKALAIACPKLDSHQELYLEKLVAMVEQAQLATITIMIMEVPCCRGLVQLVRAAVARAGRQISVRAVVVSRQGEIVGQHEV